MKALRLFFAWLVATAPLGALEIAVSPDGPIRSLAAARDAVRAARAQGDASPARVVFADGSYPLEEAVVFEPRDSGVSYEAAPGARPVFTGGKKITGWQAGADGVWTARVDPGWRFEALWVDGRRATRARTPNTGFLQAMGQPTEFIAGVPRTGDAGHTLLAVEKKHAETLAQLSPEDLREVNVLVRFSWDMNRHRLAGVRAGDGTLQFTGPLRGPFFSLAPFHNLQLENYRAALDAPGEWFLARDGTLSYLGDEPREVWAPVAPQWLVLRGEAGKNAFVEKLAFRGLSFRHQAWTLPEGGAFFGQAEAKLLAAIEADGAREIVFERCELAHTLTTAAWFRRGCRDITLRQCHLHDLGAGGVKIGDPGMAQPGPEHTSHVLVENTIIHGGGRHFPGGIGATIFHASDCTLRHCDIGDFYYSAVSIGWTWGYQPNACARNVVEYCRLHHLGWGQMSDLGAVYTLGPQPGTVIRGCHIHDVGCHAYGGWGLYNDEGSTGIVWENNLVRGTQDGGYHQHYGRGNIVRNNIFAFQKEVQIRRSKPEEFLAFAFVQNIVLFEEGRLFGHLDKNWFDGRVHTERNVYWRTGGRPFDLAGKTWDEWRHFGHDAESVIADPLFTAPEKGDWTLRPESPALRLGFKPFDWRLAGVTGDAAWRTLAAREMPPMVYGTKPKPPPLALHDGFEQTPVGGTPMQARLYRSAQTLGVVASGAWAGRHCLELRDGPEVEPAFNPHFNYAPGHARGTTRVAFAVKCEPGFHLIHEWRDDATPYRTGPMLEFQDGVIRVPGRKLAEFAPGEWFLVEVTAKVGADADGTWSCTLARPGQPPQRFTGLPFAKPMGELQWLGFIGAGRAAAKAWLDEIEIETR
jgi:hypothetical protein